MDRGFLYGDGVYETLRLYSRVELQQEVGPVARMLPAWTVFRLGKHLDRLENSAHGIRLDLPWTKDALKRAVSHVIKANQQFFSHGGAIRLTLTRGTARDT